MDTRYVPIAPDIASGARAGDGCGGTTAGRVRRLDDTRSAGAVAVSGRLPPGVLAVSIRRRGSVIELGLSGELDLATAPRLGEAMAWLRFSGGPGAPILIDTSDVEFISAAGYRALQAALVGPNGLWDPRVALVVGPAVARLEAAISDASAPRRRRPGKGGRSVSAVRDRDRP
jgi:hypothetical protein